MGARLRSARTTPEAVLEAATDDDPRVATTAHRVADEPRRAALHLEVRGRCEGDAREVRGRCEGNAREMGGRCEGDAREMAGRCEGDGALYSTLMPAPALLRTTLARSVALLPPKT